MLKKMAILFFLLAVPMVGMSAMVGCSPGTSTTSDAAHADHDHDDHDHDDHTDHAGHDH